MMSNLVFKRVLITLATVGCVTLGAPEAEAATGASTTALGGGIVTVGSVGTNQMDNTATFTIATGDTLLISGADPVSGGGNIFGRMIVLEDGATIQLDNDLTVLPPLEARGTVIINTNTGNLTANFRLQTSVDPASFIKTGAGSLIMNDALDNLHTYTPIAVPNTGVDLPEFDIQAGSIVNRIDSNDNHHIRVADGLTIDGIICDMGSQLVLRPTLIEIGNNITFNDSIRASQVVMGDGNTFTYASMGGTSGATSVIGDNNTFENSLTLETNIDGAELVIGEGNIIKEQLELWPRQGSDSVLRFNPGAVSNRLGQNVAVNTSPSLYINSYPGNTQELHIEGAVEIAGGYIYLSDGFARLHSTGSLTFTNPNINFRLESSTFQIDRNYTFDNPLYLSGSGSALSISSGTTTTINANVTGASQDLIISDTGTLLLNASVPQNIDLSSGGDFTLGAAGSVPGNVSGNNAIAQTFDISGSITGALNTGNGNNVVNINLGASVGSIATGTGDNTIIVAGTSGAVSAGGNSSITVTGVVGDLTLSSAASAAISGGTINGDVTLNNGSSINIDATSNINGDITALGNSNIALSTSPTGLVTITDGTLTINGNISSNINYQGSGTINIGGGSSLSGNLFLNTPSADVNITGQFLGEIVPDYDLTLENEAVRKLTVAAGRTLTLRNVTLLEAAEITPTADVDTKVVLDNTKVNMNTTTWANNLSKIVLKNGATIFASGNDNLSNINMDNFSSNSLDLVELNETMSATTAALTIGSYNAYDPGNEGTLVAGIDTVAGVRSQWLNVVGNLDITNSKLIVVASRDSSFKSYDDSYNIIEFGGARTGTFGTLEIQNSQRKIPSGITASADYSVANAVGVRLNKLANYASNLEATPNQTAQIDALTANNHDFLEQLDWDIRIAGQVDAKLILDQVSAEGYQMLYQNDRNQAQNFNQAMFEHSRQRLFERERPYHSTWITPSWNYARADNHGSYYGHEIKASGIDFGFDRRHKRYRMLSGLALGFRDSSSQSKLNLKDSGKHYHLGWYLHALSGPNHFMNLQASLSYNQHDSKRDIAAGDYTGRLTSDNSSYVLAADAKLGTHVFDNWGHSYTPYLALSTIYQDGDNIVESSTDTNTQNLALNVDKHNRWHGYIGLGSDMRLTRKNALIYNFHVKPVLSLEYLTEFGNNANKALDTAFSIDPDNKFAIHGIHVGRHTGSLGFSLEGLGLSKRTKGHFFNAGYNAKVRSQGNVQHAFNINYQWKW
jgi:hypothetical protein